jgi:hypothetical protein
VGLLAPHGGAYAATPELLKGESLLKVIFGYLVLLVMLFFVLTSVEQFAQMYVKEEDDAQLEELKANSKWVEHKKKATK